MSFLVEETKVYTIGEALKLAHLSRATYFRWVKQGKIHDTRFKDRNGRRVFTEEELEELKRVCQRLVEAPQKKLKF